MSTAHTEIIREAEILTGRFLDMISHHLLTTSSMADLRRVLEAEARAMLRRQYDAGYSAGCSAAYADRTGGGAPDRDTPDVHSGKGAIIPPPGGTRLG